VVLCDTTQSTQTFTVNIQWRGTSVDTRSTFAVLYDLEGQPLPHLSDAVVFLPLVGLRNKGLRGNKSQGYERPHYEGRAGDVITSTANPSSKRSAFSISCIS
jgi:hypothetical protein